MAPDRSERAVIRRFALRFGTARHVSTGIGDDAAVLRGERSGWAWTVDAQVEGVHFRRELLTFEDVGFRSFQAAVSDLAAMGARPVAALSGLIVPASARTRDLDAIARGQARAADELGCPVVGGNLSRGAELSVTTTALGRVDKPLLRSGARRGDSLYLVGPVGLAAAGLAWLERRPRRSPGCTRRAVAAWRRPSARVAEGLLIAGRASAAIDVSDGLAGDAAHLARESGVRIVIEEAALRAALDPDLLRLAELLGDDPLRLALYGGEDYALLVTARKPPPPRTKARRIGRAESGAGAFLETAAGLRRLGPGFDHLRS